MNIEQLLEKKLASSEEEARVQAVRELAGLGMHLPMALLYQAMGDISWRVRKEAAETFLALPRAGELAGDVVELLHAQDNAGLRNVAVDVLVQLGRQAVPVLLEELACSDPDVRKFVLDILGTIGDPSCVAAMMAALTDSDRNVRAAAAENLGKVGGGEALPALLEAMKDTDLLMRFTILEALGRIGRPVPVAKISCYQEDPLLRKALFDCIGRTADGSGAPVLVQGLRDRMRNVREAAAQALAALHQSHPQAVAEALALNLQAADAALAECLDSSHSPVARAAIRLAPLTGGRHCATRLLARLAHEELGHEAAGALIALGRPVLVPLLSQWSEADGRTRAYLSYLAGETGCVEAIDLLLGALSVDDPTLAMAAAQALGRLKAVVAMPALVGMLRDDGSDRRRVAQVALGLLASDYQAEILTELGPLVEDDNPEIRMAAISVLGRIDYRKVKQAMLLALKDESAEVRRAAVTALGANPAAEQLDALVLALTDEDPDVRRVGAEALGMLKSRQAVDALALALHDEDLWVRAAVIRGIGKIGTERAVTLIKEALGDPVGLVCIAALESWSELDPAGAFPQLIAFLYHEDEEVVIAALQQLVASGRRDWLPCMAEVLLNHPRWEIRLHFAQALAALEGAACRNLIENRLVIEGEELVRQSLEAILDNFNGEAG